MAGVDGAAAAVEQMKLQQEKSKEELVRRRRAAQTSSWRGHGAGCEAALPPHSPLGGPAPAARRAAHVVP